VRQPAGNLHGALQMKDDDETEDMIFSFIFIAVTIFTVLFAVAGAALVIWSFL
jgi:nitrate reductase NapE component